MFRQILVAFSKYMDFIIIVDSKHYVPIIIIIHVITKVCFKQLPDFILNLWKKIIASLDLF